MAFLKFVRSLAILIFLLFSFHYSRCQDHRLEFPVKSQQLPFDLTPVGDYGFLIMELDGIPMQHGVTQFNFKHYDANFKLTFNFPIQVNRNLYLVAKEFSDGQVVFVFQNPRINLLQVTRIILDQQMVNTSLVDISPNIVVLDLESRGDKAWISASLNDQPILFEVDLEETKIRTLPTGIGLPVTKIHDLLYIPEFGGLTYLMGVVANKKNIYALRTLNTEGKVSKDLILGQSAQVNFLSGRIRIEEGEFTIVGMYSPSQNEIPKGMGLLRGASEVEHEVRLHPFKELVDFGKTYTGDPGSLELQKGNIAQLKSSKGSISNMVFRTDNFILVEDQLMISVDVYFKTFRSRNQEERQALGENINFSVNYNRYSPNFPNDPENVSNPANNMLDDQRIRYQDNVVQSLIETGVEFHHTTFLAFDSDLMPLWNMSIRFSSQDDQFAAYNQSLNDRGLIVTTDRSASNLLAFSIESPSKLSPLPARTFATGESQITIAVMTDDWLGSRNLVWGYQQVDRRGDENQFFVQDLVMED